VRVHLGREPAWADAPPSEGGALHRSAHLDTDDEAPRVDVVRLGAFGVRFRYGDDTTFHVSADLREVWGTWVAPYTLADAAIYLVGPVLSYVLRGRGVLALHASAVVVDGRAIAFVGGGGSGKSTTAAALVTRGMPLLTDDVLALTRVGPTVLAWPGADHLRLWDDAATHLAGAAARLPLLTPTWEKRAFVAAAHGAALARDAVPLGALILLNDREAVDETPRVVPAHDALAFLGLVAETSANYLLDDAMRAAEFVALTQLLADVPVFRATPHASLDRLDVLVDRLLEVVRG
jgi:hypothetical protein